MRPVVHRVVLLVCWSITCSCFAALVQSSPRGFFVHHLFPSGLSLRKRAMGHWRTSNVEQACCLHCFITETCLVTSHFFLLVALFLPLIVSDLWKYMLVFYFCSFLWDDKMTKILFFFLSKSYSIELFWCFVRLESQLMKLTRMNWT